MGMLIRVIINAIAIWLTTLVLGENFKIIGSDTTEGQVLIFLIVALIFGICNGVIKPIVVFFTFPLYILTLGFFHLIVNTLMVLLTSWITSHTDWGLRVESFSWAILGALLISVFAFIISLVIPDARRKR